MDDRLLEIFNALGRSAAMQEAITKNQDHFQKNQEILQRQMSEMILHDGAQEERLAQLEEVVNTLSTSVRDLGVTVRHLKNVAFGFAILLFFFAALAGVVGTEALPKALSSLSAFFGL